MTEMRNMKIRNARGAQMAPNDPTAMLDQRLNLRYDMDFQSQRSCYAQEDAQAWIAVLDQGFAERISGDAGSARNLSHSANSGDEAQRALMRSRIYSAGTPFDGSARYSA
jgi:hypothetical protein